jgi:hypothetical protein
MKPISTAKLGDHFYPVNVRFRSSAAAKKLFITRRWWGHVTADTLSNVWDHVDMSHADPQFYQLMFGYDATGKKLIRIETGRREDEINDAISIGFTPIFREVAPSPNLNKQFRILQNRNSNEIFVDNDGGDPRTGEKKDIHNEDLWQVIVPWQEYYPHHFRNPYAAYLIPPGLKPGQKVILKDVIEDYYAGEQHIKGGGLTNRCAALGAVWNGKDLEIEYHRYRDVSFVTY